jgi:hypothetical protein
MNVTCNINNSAPAPTTNGTLIVVGDTNMNFTMNYAATDFVKFETALTVQLATFTPVAINVMNASALLTNYLF